MSRIHQIHAREVLDSRGNPTVEVDVRCDDGALGRAIVPSGASTGAAEALELRDGNADRYDGLGVRNAIDNVLQVIGPELVGHEAGDQQGVDLRLIELDGTPDKSKLGANALLGVSLAAAHAAAASSRVPLYRHIACLTRTECGLPRPMVNMISGGRHAGGNLDFQDFMVMPMGRGDFSWQLESIVKVYRSLGDLLAQRGYSRQLVADEGGYGPNLSGAREALELVTQAIEAAGLRPGDQMAITVDVAASQFFDGTQYRLAETPADRLTNSQLVDRLEALTDQFPVVSIEDGLADEDWDGWQQLYQRLGHRVQLIGDDLIATNPERLGKAAALKAANAVLIKPNQIGTLSETLDVISAAAEAGLTRIVSARSGETEDTTIADLAVGTGAEQIKIGSVTRSERLAKYNRLLRIAEELIA